MRRTFPLDHRIPALHLSFFVQTFGPLVLSLACLPLAGQAHAQAPITQSGLNTQVSPPIAVGTQTQYNITGGTRPGGTSGTNLFHSFGNFNVPTNNIANFLNESALPTNNILGRVTGGNLSSIYGTIQTTGFGNANLFLMNPAGFLFGPNATVNVGGMVAFTSADYLRLIDGVRFNATPNATADALLTPSPVAAFGFLGSNPGAITVQGSQFSVTDGQSISLVGGDITIQSGTLDDGTVQSAKLSAPGGQINLASVASPGEVSAVDFMPTSGMTMGNISLSQDTLLDVSADAAGTVRIRGGQLVMDHATISADTVNSNGAPLAIDINLASDLSISSAAVPALTARTTGTGDAGEIRISAQNIEMTATGYGDFTPFAVIDTHTSGSGKAGDVNITASNNIAFNGDPFDFVFAIDSGTIGLDGGHGGNVALNAKNVDFQYAQIGTGDFVAVYSFADAVGSGGNLTINADSLNLTNSFLVTDGFFGGRGGDLTISARDVQMNQFSALSASGFLKGGTLRINADHFFVDSSQMEAFAGPEGGGAIIFNGKVGQFTNGTTIQSGTGSPGNAGNITFTATERLTFADSTYLDLAPIRPSGLFTTSIFSTGNAGEITVNTPVLELTGGARFDATTRTLGDGGRITVNADTISISGERPLPIFEGPLFGLATSMASGIYSRTAQSRFCGGGCGKAGSISITTDSLSLTQGARIDTNTTSAGLGGDITITANQISIAGTTIDGTSGGIFTAASAAGAGGNISLNANSVTLQNGGTLSAATSGTEASATGGTITVKADQVQLNSGTTVSAETTGAGKAGSIDIAAQRISLTGGSQITASTGTPTSGSGDAGAIRITATESLSLTDASLIASNSNSTSADAGHAGLIELTAPSIDLQGSSLLTSSTRGPGNAGSIILNLAQLSLSDFSNIATSTTGPGRGGDITVQGLAGPGSHAETVTLSGASRLGAESMDCCGTGSVGDAGSISVATGKLLLTGNSQIVTSTQVGSGNAGDIIINATDEVRLSESRLASESIAFATGDAGAVTVTAPNVVLENQGLISTSTEFTGKAGDITVNANSLQLTSGAQITSNSRNAVMELITEFPEFADFFLVTGPAGAAGTVTVHGSAGPANTVFIDGAGSGIFTETRAEGAGGNITLSANSVTLQNGGTLSAATSGTGNAGNISVIADQVTLTNFAQMTTSTTGPGSGGTIHLSAEDTISLTDSFISASSNSTGSDAGSGGQITLRAPTLSVVGGVVSTITLGSGNAGNIHIQAGTFGLGTSEGAPGLVEATTSGAGHGGNISIVGLTGPGSPANDVTLSGFSSIRSETLNNQGGTAGDITIETMRLALTEGSAITTASRLNSPGNAGNVTLNATESILVSGSYVTSDVLEGSTGNGGQVTIKTPDLTVNQSSEGFGGLISTSTGSSGSAGTVTINTNSLTLTEGGRLASRSFLDDPIYPTATGAAGAVVVQGMSGDSSRANSIVINGQDGFGNVSGIFTNTEGSGHGGNMALFANTVSLQSGATLSAATSGTAPSAIGGTIAVDASNTVTMTGGATMTANSSGAADAGSINISALNGFSMQNSTITTQVTPSAGSSAGGGNIKITTSPEATVLLQNSTISASVADGPGGGGNISIDPQFVILQNSQILAQAAQGQGGAITIVAGLFLPDATSVVNADSGSGLNGNITIQSPNSPASGKIIPLSDRPLIAAALLSQRCAALAGGNFSSFTLAGRESLPAEPGGWLSAPLAFGGDTEKPASAAAHMHRPASLLQDGSVSLRQMGPTLFMAQSQSNEWAGCVIGPGGNG